MFVVFLLLLALASALVLKDLKLDNNITKVIPMSDSLKKTKEKLDQLKVLDKLVVAFKSEDSLQTDRLATFADRFVSDLDSLKIENVGDIRYKFETNTVGQLYEFFYQHLPLFLDDEDYKQIAQTIDSASVYRALDGAYKSLLSPAGYGTKKFLLKDPLSWTPMVLKKLKAMDAGGQFDVLNQRLYSKDWKSLFLFIETNAKDQNNNAKLVAFLESQKSFLEGEKIKLHFFGASPVAYANQQQIKQDILLTVAIAFTLVLVLISWFFKSWRVFPTLFLPVLFGSALGLSLMVLFKTEISAMALGVASIILGITIDYGLHIYTHLWQSGDIRRTLKILTPTLLLSALTTSIAFLILIQIHSEAFTDLAILAALSAMSVAVFALIIVPQIFKLKNNSSPSFRQIPSWTKKWSAKYSLLAIVSLSVFLSFGVKKIYFDGDLLNLNYLTPQLQSDQDFVNRYTSGGRKDVYVSAEGANIEQALQASEQVKHKLDSLQKLGLIHSYLSVSNLWLSQEAQNQKLKQWQLFWQKHSKSDLEFWIQNASEELGFKQNAFDAYYNWLNSHFKTITNQEYEVVQNLFFKELIEVSPKDVQLLSVVKMEQNGSKALQQFYTSFNNQKSVLAFDKQRFNEILLDDLKINFSHLVWWSTIAVFIVLLIYYGRIELVIINMTPILLSWLWTLGLAGWLGISFNIFNVIISSLIFGLGVDYSIAITQGLLSEYKTGHRSLAAFRISVIFSAITTFAGVGVLVFAEHPALKSMALITVLGMASVLILALVLIPIMFKFLINYRSKPRRQAVTFVSFLMSNISMAMVLGAMIGAVTTSWALQVFPLKTKYKKLFFHFLIQWSSKLVVYTNINTPKIISNLDRNTFKKPAIIVANHQSQLDLVFLLMLSPKMIVVTNHWVWHHFILKHFVRYADYYPVYEGIQGAEAQLKKKIDEGYSVLIFPEGTRTENGQIKRFHKGAFQLAHDLKVDVLPIMLFGAFEALNKHEFFLHKSTVYIKIMDRIIASEHAKYASVKAFAKDVQDKMRAEYSKTQKEISLPEFYRPYILNRFIYKGPVVEWYARIKTSMEKNYQMFDNLISPQAKIVDLGCGYGFMSQFLAQCRPERKVYGFDYDTDKIEVAQKSAYYLPNLSFDVLDITQDWDLNADVYLLADVLHYMPEQMQATVVQRCFKNLRSGGQLIIRDANAEMQKKHQRTRFTEFLSTKIIGFNKTHDADKQLYFVTKDKLLSYLTSENADVEVLDKTKYLSNLVYIIKKD
ncbi:MAG: 1-acyl-sn-glycerol-3-phosphate acyltransferase [Bacteroidales bacterium]|nr:1-acyl-sn-glycerol-3-phosphate acyltransferase [Bacteroidales bacterium]